MKLIGKWQGLEKIKGASVLKLALSVGNITSGAAGMVYAMPPQLYFDDNLFFEVREDEKRKKYFPRPDSQVGFLLDLTSLGPYRLIGVNLRLIL